MKCRECGCCKKGWFDYMPEVYVCTGVKEPFAIDDINHECIEYPERRTKMKSSELLLSLDGEHLEVFRNVRGICVEYKGAEVKEGMFLKDAYGVGEDFESACDDYIKQIRGKTLVFGACTNSRREVKILG